MVGGATDFQRVQRAESSGKRCLRFYGLSSVHKQGTQLGHTSEYLQIVVFQGYVPNPEHTQLIEGSKRLDVSSNFGR